MTTPATEIKRIKRYIEEYNDILIFYSLKNNPSLCFLAMSLLFSLENLNKNASILNNSLAKDCLPLNIEGLLKDQHKPSSKANFVISIKERDNFKISSISYEKTDENLNIFLAGSGDLNKKDIILKENNKETLLITIGTQYLNDVSSLPNRTFLVLNIDNSKENENFGQINLIDPYSLVSENTFELINLLRKNEADKLPALPLLLAFLKETFSFRDIPLKTKTFEQISSLKAILSLEEKETLDKWLFTVKNKEERFFYFSLLEAYSKDCDNIIFTFSKNDFEKIGASYTDIPFMLKRFAPAFQDKKELLVLWEQNSSPLAVRGIFYSNKASKKEAIFKSFESKEKNNWLLFKTPFKDIKTAQEEIKKLIY
ncbi:MAG: hypothetical protein Q8N55_02405 [bacterium]|nr:hypothetical protein [bacterium]